MDKKQAKRIRRYFKGFPRWSLLFILLGLLFLSVNWNDLLSWGAASGIALLLWGVWALILWFRRPRDAEIDSLLARGLQDLEKRALIATALTDADLIQKNQVVRGPRFWNVAGATAGIKRGKDRVVRFTPVGVTVFNFTSKQIVAYQCAYDLIAGRPVVESTDEYFYCDVVSVSTRCQSFTWDKAMLDAHGLSAGRLKKLVVDGELRFTAAETFVLTTSGGTSIEIVLKDPGLIKCAGGGKIPTDHAEAAVMSVRKLLREKKADTRTAQQ